MADTTAIYGWPFQEVDDPPNGATLGQELAEAIEATVDSIDDRVSVLEPATTTKPIGRIEQNTPQTGITDNTETAITFDTEDFDTAGYHSTSSNTSRVTPTLAGKYRVVGTVCLASASDYVFVEAIIRKNGTTNMRGSTRVAAPVSTTVLVQVSGMVTMNGSGDYFELVMLADRSGNTATNTTVSGHRRSTLEWEYVRP